MAIIYETDLQLFPKKSEVKLQKHLKIVRGEKRLLKTGKTCEAVSEGESVIVHAKKL